MVSILPEDMPQPNTIHRTEVFEHFYAKSGALYKHCRVFIRMKGKPPMRVYYAINRELINPKLVFYETLGESSQAFDDIAESLQIEEVL